MTSRIELPSQLIWATRGYSWGFRFLLDGGFSDPLREYERAFAGLADAPAAWGRAGRAVALRLLDPQGRRDFAGRVIPHEFVVFGDMVDVVDSVSEGLQRLWPLVERAYDRVWNVDTAPSVDDLRFDWP